MILTPRPSLNPCHDRLAQHFQDAAMAMNANLSLVFYAEEESSPAYTLFSFDLKLIPTDPPEEQGTTAEVDMILPNGTMLICADDDRAPRLAYKGLIKKLRVTNSMVLGSTYAEISELVTTVLDASSEFGEARVVCIFDQHMDAYDEGRILGTDVTRELRDAGFKGVIFIRSANDDAASCLFYRSAGANACLGKSVNVTQLVVDITRECHLAWSMEAWT